jgi:hypothetical protein
MFRIAHLSFSFAVVELTVVHPVEVQTEPKVTTRAAGEIPGLGTWRRWQSGYGRPVRRRSLLVLAAGAVVVVLLVAAASARPVRLWTARSAAPAEVARHTAGSTVPAAPASLLPEPTGLSSRTAAVLQILAILLLALMLGVGIPMARALARPTQAPPEARAPGGHETSALPDGPELDVVVAVDLAAARAALSEGPPRNAIVACWMQLERDAAAAGLSRIASETSAEYAARVVAKASVDPAPIAELAALYREARFSRHELGDEHRARALASLDRVAAALGAAVPA